MISSLSMTRGFVLLAAWGASCCGGQAHGPSAQSPESSGKTTSGELPDHAHPSGGGVDPDSIRGKDLIAYRTLTPSDFKAAQPPEEMRQYAERLGALTCANVFTDPRPRYFIEQTERGFEGAYMNLAFVARLDRECSWWNPIKTRVPEEYVLQHEQIHFALAESTAKRLNLDAAKILESRIKGSSQSEVDKQLRAVVEELLDTAIQELLQRNLEFDRETSNTYAPQAQKLWFEKVMKELGKR